MNDTPLRPQQISAVQARRELLQRLSLALVEFGADARELTASGQAPAVRQLLPAGLVAAIGGELLASVAFLAEGRWAYAGSALVRQVVEVEYLAWAVTNDPDDAWEWMKSDRRTRLDRWQPGKIRQRAGGRFPNSDYHEHCEAGGHPVPEPAMTILDNRDAWVAVTMHEACLHGAAVWHYLLKAVEAIGPLGRCEQNHQLVDRAYASWRAVDTLGDQLKPDVSEKRPRRPRRSV